MGTDERIDRLFARQHGVITRDQAIRAGLGRDQIYRRMRAHRWRRAAPGVYRVAAAAITPQQQAVVACLAGPPGTIASHETAAALLGLRPFPEKPHVTVPPGTSGRSADAVRHRSPVEPVDVCVVDGIRCTHPARTIVDCAAILGYEALCELIDDALCRRLTKRSTVRAAMARSSSDGRRSGLVQLERALEPWTPGPVPGSPAEMRLIRRIMDLGFPRPERQVELYDADARFVARIDVGWSEQRFGLEYLGERYHGPRHWEADDDRNDRITACGWRVDCVDRFDLRPGSTRLAEILERVFGPPTTA